MRYTHNTTQFCQMGGVGWGVECIDLSTTSGSPSLSKTHRSTLRLSGGWLSLRNSSSTCSLLLDLSSPQSSARHTMSGNILPADVYRYQHMKKDHACQENSAAYCRWHGCR
jgi:hypothetical protein